MTKTRKIIIALFTTLVLIYIACTAFVPEIIDKRFNTVIHAAPYNISPQVQKIYDSFDFVADLHSDVLLWRRDILKHNDFGHEDVPRMLQAKLALQAFTIVNKVPKGLNFKKNDGHSDQLFWPQILQRRPVASWFSLSERVISQANDLHQFSQDSKGKLTVIQSKKDLVNYLEKRHRDPTITAGFIGIEGAQAFEGKLNNIEKLYTAGVRMVGLTHFFDNEIGGSAHGVDKGGLTNFGRRVVGIMEQKRMLIDLSHASSKLFDEVLDIAKNPVIISHSGVKGTCNNNRNLSDAQLHKVAQNGGIVGIAMFEVAVCGTTPEAIAEAISYTANLIGPQHVALGSDFDGAVHSIIEVRGLPLIVDALLKQGMSEKDIRLIMGDNVRQFLLNNLPDV